MKQAYLRTKEAEQNIVTIEKAVEQAKENLRITEEQYKEQVATQTDVLIAQTLLTQTMTNYLQRPVRFQNRPGRPHAGARPGNLRMTDREGTPADHPSVPRASRLRPLSSAHRPELRDPQERTGVHLRPERGRQDHPAPAPLRREPEPPKGEIAIDGIRLEDHPARAACRCCGASSASFSRTTS
ncbi:MAG: TolC family protein [Desulfobacterales bacterium]|nr:TolC family protein [Desulfobacterales bacterium]